MLMQGRIEICGGIASGKTTLASVLEREGFVAIYEKFDANPFLNEFYVNKTINSSFETEITFVLLHYNWIKTLLSEKKVVCDYAMLQDLSYGKNNLSFEEIAIFESLYNHLMTQICSPILTIYLKCNVDCLLERIKQRGRIFEQGIDRAYLQSSIKALEEELKNKKNLLII